LILKSCDDLISSRFGRIKSQIFKMILNQIKSRKNDLDHDFLKVMQSNDPTVCLLPPVM